MEKLGPETRPATRAKGKKALEGLTLATIPFTTQNYHKIPPNSKPGSIIPQWAQKRELEIFEHSK